MFYFVFAGEMPKGKYVKIFYTDENFRPNFDVCDWAFTFDYDEELNHPRHMRVLPYLYILYANGEDLVKKNIDVEKIKREKTKFCNFVYSHNCHYRVKFFKKLSRVNFFKKLSNYKRVDAPGQSMNNMPPGRISYEHKMDFIKNYKFTIAMENSSHPGYTSEKIYDAMRANSIPIYWGNPLIHRDFNTKSFVSYYDFERPIKSKMPKILKILFKIPKLGGFIEKVIMEPIIMDKVVKRVIEIDNDDKLYERYLREPWCNNNESPVNAYLERLEKRFKEIFG